MKNAKRLQILNGAAAALHAIQATIMFFASTDFGLPLTTSFLSFNVQSRQLEPMLDMVATLRIGPLVALFLYITAFVHLLLVFSGVRNWYEKNIAKGINPARWMEYSLTSSIMIVIIAMLVGVYDIAALLLLFFVNAGMILFGWVMEAHNQTTKKTNWISYIFGTILGIVPWVIVAMYLIGATEPGARPPNFVYWIFFSIFIFFNTFAINMLLQYKKVGKWKDYIYGEFMYIVLSLASKSLLAWLVWAGTLRPV